jgi:hypothetical protein
MSRTGDLAGRHATKEERQRRRHGWRPLLEGRAEFVTANAVSLLADRDRRIVAMRQEIRKLERKWRGLAKELVRARRGQERRQVELVFVLASVGVWRHLDQYGQCPAPEALDEGVELRRLERWAWEKFRAVLEEDRSA